MTDPRGLDVVTTVADKTITIKLNIALQGPNASPELAASWQKSINSMWNAKSWKYGSCSVKIDATVGSGGTAQNNIFVDTDGRSFVNKVGGNTGTWYKNDPDISWVVAHESGHLMGEDDYYKDIKTSGGQTISKAYPGWENNIMAARGGQVEQKNINRIVRDNSPFPILRECLCPL